MVFGTLKSLIHKDAFLKLEVNDLQGKQHCTVGAVGRVPPPRWRLCCQPRCVVNVWSGGEAGGWVGSVCFNRGSRYQFKIIQRIYCINQLLYRGWFGVFRCCELIRGWFGV